MPASHSVRLAGCAALLVAAACTGDDTGAAFGGSTSEHTGTGHSTAPSTDSNSADGTGRDEGSDAQTGPSASSDDGDSTGDVDTGGETSGETSGGFQACAVVDVEGVCQQASTCDADSTAFGGLCDDIPSVQCCVPSSPPCSVDGAPGLCMDVDGCAAISTPGLCPGDATVQCCTDPATACDPEVMPQPNEGLTEQSWDPTCPDGMIASDGFCIDRHEAALVELDGDGAVVGSWSPYFNPGTTRVRAVSLDGAVPQGYINQVQAGAACDEAGKRLCTDDEWLRACQGAAGTTYPYGDALEPGRCNDARATHPAVELFGTADAWVFSELDHPCISQIPASLDITGLNPLCESQDGALDMMGNLHEWTTDPTGTFRGGFFADTSINGPGCQYQTTAHNVQHWDYSTGFRCCADA